MEDGGIEAASFCTLPVEEAALPFLMSVIMGTSVLLALDELAAAEPDGVLEPLAEELIRALLPETGSIGDPSASGGLAIRSRSGTGAGGANLVLEGIGRLVTGRMK